MFWKKHFSRVWALENTSKQSSSSIHTYTKTKDSHPALSVFYEQLPLAQRSNAAVLSPFKNKKKPIVRTQSSPLFCLPFKGKKHNVDSS